MKRTKKEALKKKESKFGGLTLNLKEIKLSTASSSREFENQAENKEKTYKNKSRRDRMGSFSELNLVVIEDSGV